MIKRFLIIKQSIKKDNYQILGVKVESLSEDYFPPPTSHLQRENRSVPC